MPKTALVLFDMHDVLCRYDREKRLAGLAALSGRTAPAVFEAIWTSGFEAQADAGALDATSYLRGFGKRLGYPITLPQWLDNRHDCLTPMPDTLAMMAEVRARTKVAVLTNNHTLVQDHLEAIFPELARLCGDQCYVSAQFGAAKPSPEVYRRCVAAAGVAPEQALFIDDAQANVDGALAAGLRAVRFTNSGSLRGTLAGEGLLTGG